MCVDRCFCRDTTNARLHLQLPELQNLCKRDPEGYHEEFSLQHRHFMTELEIFRLKPGKGSEHFGALINYMSHMVQCYPKDLSQFPGQMIELLEKHHANLDPKLRMTMAMGLILIRNREQLEPTTLLSTFFRLFSIEDKKLRELIYSHILSDISNQNKKGRNEKTNRKIQSFMFGILQGDNEFAAKKALEILVALYRAKVWTDSRTVNVIATACTSSSVKLMVSAIHFFLNIEAKIAEDEEESAEDNDWMGLMHSKKTKKRVNQKIRARKSRALRITKKQTAENKGNSMFAAIHLLNDPQTLAEKMFRIVKKSNERFEVKLITFNFISRLIGTHQLLVLPFYAHIQRYLTSHQQHVTQILAYVVQSCHPMVPPEEIQPVVRTIANGFVTDRCSPDVTAVGINAIREIVVRVPLVLEGDEMDPILQDLVEKHKSKEKSIMIAGRSFLNMLREVFPALLHRTKRGKFHDATARPAAYGEVRALEGVDGADLLAAKEAEMLANGESWADLPSEESDSSDDDGWTKVQSSGDEGDFVEVEQSEDSEDEEDDPEAWREASDSEKDEEADKPSPRKKMRKAEDADEGEEGDDESAGSEEDEEHAEAPPRKKRRAEKQAEEEESSQSAHEAMAERQRTRIDANRILTAEVSLTCRVCDCKVFPY